MTNHSGDDRPVPDPLVFVGIAFMGAGVALMVAVGPAMISLLALGVIFMAIGFSRMRNQPNDD